MTSAYLVLDMQNDLIHADGPSGKGPLGEQVRARDIIANTNSAIAKARAADVPVIFVVVGFSPDYRECPPHSPMFGGARQHGLFKLGGFGTQVHPELDRRDGDFLVVKHRVSPFYATSLEAILRARGVGKLVISGVSTAAVVQAAVRDGHDRDHVCTVLEDCCAAATADEHDGSIAVLRKFAAIETSAALSF